MGMAMNIRERIAKRAAEEIGDGMIVNLGIGIPTLVANYVKGSIHVLFHAENGVLGIGPSPDSGKEDPALCNAGGIPITAVPGASYFNSADAFGIIRKGLVDIAILGALEVSAKGDLANWIIPGKRVPGIGGAMELAQKAKKVIVLMNHTNKQGESKILPCCSLPLTAKGCVQLIITEMAVMEVGEHGLTLKEVMAPHTVESVIQHTEAELIIPSMVRSIG